MPKDTGNDHTISLRILSLMKLLLRILICTEEREILAMQRTGTKPLGDQYTMIH